MMMCCPSGTHTNNDLGYGLTLEQWVVNSSSSGTLNLSLSASQQGEYQVVVLSTSGAQLKPIQAVATHQAGSPAALNAEATDDSGSPQGGLVVSAAITRPDGVEDSQFLSGGPNGTYSGTLTDTSLPGLYLVRYTTQWGDFRREGVQTLTVVSGDSDKDGLTDMNELEVHGTDPFYSEGDSDGDGYTDAVEAGAFLCAGAVNDDNFDDSIVNDGCPAVAFAEANCAGSSDEDNDGRVNDGCSQAGTLSEAQFSVGTDLDVRCEAGSSPAVSGGWPADLISAGVPNSTDRVNIRDITSFLAPTNRLNSSPGNPNFNARWDLVPGRGPVTHWINIQDLSNLIAVMPAMPPFNGSTRALNGAACSDS
jgi:hypothetical protein